MIAIFAFTHRFVAGAEFAPVPSVFRVSETPPTDSVVCALTVVTPVTADVRSIVQFPLAFVEQDVADTFPFDSVPGPESIVKLTSAPTAGTNPVPSFTFTCAVNVCVAPTRFTPFGLIWMFASTTRSGSHGPSEGL